MRLQGHDISPTTLRWLMPFISARYYTKCEHHGGGNNHDNNMGRRHRKSPVCNLYCVDCREIVCPNCTTSPRHGAHVFLQVRLASNECCVRSGDMVGLMDTTGIHKFSINGKKIHFLRCRQSSFPQARPDVIIGRKKPPLRRGGGGSDSSACCHRCHWKLPGGEDQSSTFCSIQCKLLSDKDWGQAGSAAAATSPDLQEQQQEQHGGIHNDVTAADAFRRYQEVQPRRGKEAVVVDGETATATTTETERRPTIVLKLNNARHEIEIEAAEIINEKKMNSGGGSSSSAALSVNNNISTGGGWQKLEETCREARSHGRAACLRVGARRRKGTPVRSPMF